MSLKFMNVKEVAKKVLNKDDLFILDVRNQADFDDWKIEGNRFQYVNEPYVDLVDRVDSVIDQLPKDQDVLVVCARGNSSQLAGEILVEKGIDNVYSLEGGMKAWSEYLEPIKIADLTDGGELYQFVRLGKGCLSYMIISGDEAATIDAVRMTDVFTNFADKKGARITQVFDTHLHADHISGGRMLAEKTGATYWLPPKDATEVQFNYQPLEDYQEIRIGSSKVAVHALYSPGHTIGSTSLIVDDRYLFSGDILFVDSIGRPDLAGKAEDWVGDLRNTLYSRYKEISEDLIVLPAHFMTNKELNEDGSVGKELGKLYEENHGLNVEDEDEFRRMVTENLPPQPNAYQEIRDINMGKISPDLEKQREMEIGPNRCAIK